MTTTMTTTTSRPTNPTATSAISLAAQTLVGATDGGQQPLRHLAGAPAPQAARRSGHGTSTRHFVGRLGMASLVFAAALGCNRDRPASDASGGLGEANGESPAPAPPGAAMTAKVDSGRAEIGKPAPNFSLPDTEGNAVELASFRGKLVVLEWFNPDCPFVKRNHGEGPLKTMGNDEASRGVAWLAINSGAPGKQGHGVDRNRDGRRAFAMNYPVLLDETGEVGRAYGAKTTPHVFVIDEAGTLVYAGAIDNAQDGETPGGEPFKNYVAQALADVRAKRPVALPRTDAYGCSVKYGQ
jgi:peroxiredoxin